MITIIKKLENGNVISMDDNKDIRTTSLTVFNMCKRVGFPTFRPKYNYPLIKVKNNQISPQEYLATLVDLMDNSVTPLTGGK